VQVLGMCGALRAGSTNLMLLREAARVLAPDAFVEGDLRLPLYDGDLEDQGIPASVLRLADQLRAADAVIIATPEYNKALSGVLKNALDWLSRVKPGGLWLDKPVAIMSAAGGRAGGERAQFSLRLCLNAFRPRVLPGPELMVAHSDQAFDDQGRLIDPRTLKTLADLMADLRAAVATRP
jgi:chromate reductase, NAD(P)H dehydrogenase (quinone)